MHAICPGLHRFGETTLLIYPGPTLSARLFLYFDYLHGYDPFEFALQHRKKTSKGETNVRGVLLSYLKDQNTPPNAENHANSGSQN